MHRQKVGPDSRCHSTTYPKVAAHSWCVGLAPTKQPHLFPDIFPPRNRFRITSGWNPL